jgi:copper chaperone CopZ
MTDQTVAETLNRAADLIEAEGWRQHGLGRPGGPHCAIGAIRRVDGIPEVEVFPSKGTHTYEAAEVLLAHTGFVTDVADWNDAPERTAAQVVEVLRAAAVIAAAKEVDVRVVAPRVAVSA